MSTLLKFSIFSLFFFPSAVFAASISVIPEHPIQGDPLMITISGTTTVSSISFNGNKLGVFIYKGKPTAFYGVDLYYKVGTYEALARLSDGSVVSTTVDIGKLEKPSAPLGIPAKLGGNTQAAATQLVDTLAAENAGLLHLRTGTRAFWTSDFGYPVLDSLITDSYGYQRKTGTYSIAHKGTDFKAKEGTLVHAMNRGVVRVARYGRNYGNTLVIDHGLGLQTFYLHLSRISVNEGELVQKGQVIGHSGQTGYATEPHLHLTIRMNDISIDPEKFLSFFK